MHRLLPSLAALLLAATPCFARGPVVVELFTSEGCSSCPPADAALSALRKQQPGLDGPILLSWHVDYWDRLGWADPWSKPEFSQRQQNFANSIHSERVYTPQAIVNGTVEFVGSHTDQLKAEVAAAVAKPPELQVTATARQADAAHIAVAWKLGGAQAPPAGSRVEVMLTEDGLISAVARGENEGRTLRHDGVVRAVSAPFPTAPTQGETTVAIPEGFKVGNGRAVVVVRALQSYAILGAAQVPLAPVGS